MQKIKVGIIGTGFIGPTHIEAIRRLGFVEIVGFAETSLETAEKKAAELGIPKAYGDYREMLKDSEIQESIIVRQTTCIFRLIKKLF